MKRSFAIFIILVLLVTIIPTNAQGMLPEQYQVVRQDAILLDAEGIPIGMAEYWNTRNNVMVELNFYGTDWNVTTSQIYLGTEPPETKVGKPTPGKFPCVRDLIGQHGNIMLQCSLKDDFDFTWGRERTRYIAIHGDLVKLDESGSVIEENDYWAMPVNDLGEPEAYTLFPALKWGGYFTITLYHPEHGHFIDSPVLGLTYRTPTQWGTTDDSGGFDYFPGERVELWLGSVYLGNPVADHKISPLDVFESYDINDPAVINMARLLQSLDADGEPKGGISITPAVISCFDSVLAESSYTDLYFNDDGMIDYVINQTVSACYGVPDVTLVAVSAEDAKANLDKSLDSSMFRKNISRSPDMSSSKSKLDVMARWFPAMKADGTPLSIEYYDEAGTLIRTATEAKPIVVTYTDGVEETGKEDIFAAISRDDGTTFKRVNLSRAADKSSFTLANGLPYYGEAKKPVVQVKGNYILVAWTSKFCNGGRPAYAIRVDDPLTAEVEDDYPYDDPYYTEDIWGVAGPQRSVDYAELDFPEVGEVPYSCVWTARGVIATDADVAAGFGEFVGDIVWFKPERLTSGRRDANQVFAGGADGAGFAIAWQEDPEGLRPGQAKGPGPGWGGATTNHKTDIWYSHITWDNFKLVDTNFISGGDPVHEDADVVGRLKALVPMSLPVRVTDNDTLNSENILATTTDFVNWTPGFKDVEGEGEGDGTHNYGYMVDGLCEGWYPKVNEQGELKNVCITADGRLLDGDTGASRPNLFLQKYKNNNGTPSNTADDYFSAWAIFAYDESKGLGSGPPEEPGIPNEGDSPYLPEAGKNSFYHSFDFRNPDLVSAGTQINLPEKDYTVDETTGAVTIVNNITYVVDELGNQLLEPLPVLDENGMSTGVIDLQPQINYENARRPRFIMQGKSGIGESGTIMVILYKEGEEGGGRPSDIMMRRVVVPSTDTSQMNPYRPANIVCNMWETAANGQTVCVDGAQNLSTVHPTIMTSSMGDPTSEDPYGAIKVVEWEQTPAITANPSGVNRYEDARAHRGDINGDFLAIAYSYTPNWAAFRNGNDKYDLYVRRSFDGGLTWTTDPAGSGVTHCDTFTDPTQEDSDGNGHLKYEVCWTFGPGEFERARNLSQLPNSKSSVIEPRLVAPPGTIKNPDGTATGYPEDINNPNVFYVSYGTATNPDQINPEEGAETEALPMDLYYSFTMDRGETYVEVAWDVNPDSDGNYAGETVYRWDFLAKGDPEQGEAQLRMTPDGSRFYSTWLEDAIDGSDIWFRRVMSPVFPANVAAPITTP